ncbi:MAG: glycosyltransferase family 4 protein [Vampirovibrio sp.]|nr:glycosyltransferase family 4 protein [Vampirovibrio sp.]
MKILISAYACEPQAGSEPGVGWNWAKQLSAMGHDVWVLTRQNNQNNIESALHQFSEDSQIHFEYVDLPPFLRAWKKGRQLIHLYYFVWQMLAFFKAKALHRQVTFDTVHHVTFVSARMPSLMGLLGIPFILGPIAGGEHAPWVLRKSYPFAGWIADFARDLSNFWVRFDPWMHLTFATAQRIYVTSSQTYDLVPRQYQSKCSIQLAIGYEGDYIEKPPIQGDEQDIKLLFVGQLRYLKGVHFALYAFLALLQTCPNARFTIVGSGPEEMWLKNIASELSLDHQIDWVPWVERTALNEIYERHDVLVFPSLHDSGGMVVLEAMAQGLPVVCLDLGGPGIIVDETSGRVIQTQGISEEQVIQYLEDAFCELAKNNKIRQQLCRGAVQRVQAFTWRHLVEKIYGQSQLAASDTMQKEALSP